MPLDFTQLAWGPTIRSELQRIAKLSLAEDLHHAFDWTTNCLVPERALGKGTIIARQPGVVAGIEIGPLVLAELGNQVEWRPLVNDGDFVEPGSRIAELAGSARQLLIAERAILNTMGHLCGIASLTRRYVELICGTNAHVYDTRKTLPGWRMLEKYAVRCGGGRNHRMSLADAILIKDNHLQFGCATTQSESFGPGQAVRRAREFLCQQPIPYKDMIVEVEVTSLEQLHEVLPEAPDLVLLDNMSPAMLLASVEIRNRSYPTIGLEASGGITLRTIRSVAETGVDRISVGSLTHSAPALDLALDW